MATLGEYLPNSNTKLLLHLNGNSNDSSSSGNNGTDTNITYVDGKFGKCASFNGTSSNIAIADTGNYLDFGTGDFTFITWLYPTNFPSSNSRFIFAKGDVSTSMWLRIENSSGQLRFLTGQEGYLTILEPDASTALTLNAWQMVACGRRGTTLFININGKDVKTTTGTIRNADNSSAMYIGSTVDGTGEFYQGNMDELFFENKGWTKTELAKHYTYTKGRFGII